MRSLLLLALLAFGPIAKSQSAQPPPVHVSGTVVDLDTGRPLSHVTVCFTRDRQLGDISGQRCDETDTRGAFNIPGLPSGRFKYGAMRQGFFPAEPLAVGLPSFVTLNPGDDLRDIKLRMRAGGVITGRVAYADGEPFTFAAVSVSGGPSGDARAYTNDLGEYRVANLRPGDYVVHVRSTTQIPNCDFFNAQRPRIYVDESADRPASPLHLDAGQTMIQPDFVMVSVTPRRIDGRIVLDHYPLSAPWMLSMGNMPRAVVKPLDGSFSFCGVPPGEYEIQSLAIFGGRTAAAYLKVRVADEDLKGVEIVPDISATIRARIEGEDNISLDLTRARITASSIEVNPHDQVPQSRLQSDGTFLIEDLYTSEYRFFVPELPPGAYLKSIRLGGREFLESPMMVQSGETIDGLVFTVSAKAGRLNGVVKDETGGVVPDAEVIVQPDPPHGVQDIHRCVQSTDQNGAFTCGNLAPGKYSAAAWRTSPGLDWQATVNASGTPVEIPESGDVAITVPLSKP